MSDDAADVLPLKPVDFQVLLVLLEGELHGYGIMKAVEEQSGGAVTLEVGSLYRLLGRMLDEGLVELAGREAGGRRKLYRIAPLGRLAARREARRLERVLSQARARDLLEEA